MEVVIISSTYVDSVSNVEEFINETQALLNDGSFNLHNNFILLKRRNDGNGPDDPNNNKNTLIELNYDASDIVDELITIKKEHYVENMIDDDRTKKVDWRVFCKIIKGRQVYIKYKFSEVVDSQILMISFHFAKHKVMDQDFHYK